MAIRQPIVVVLGHVDHGKTSLLDRIRGTSIAAKEAGAITQHIGASLLPAAVLKKICGGLLGRFKFEIEVPGLLFIDTPGHSAFSNLRKRGGSVADIAILVIDLMRGVEPQSLESIEILRARKTPFVIAANKLDLISGWRSKEGRSALEALRAQEASVLSLFDEKFYSIIGSLSMQKFNTDRFDRVKDFTKTLAIVPVSAKTGEGLPDLFTVLVGLTQQFMRGRLTLTEGAGRGTVLEVREDVGLGVNINAIFYDGILREEDTIVLGGRRGPLQAKIRAILLPKPLDEIRDPREKFKHVREVHAAAGVKIVAPGLEEVIPGSPIYAVNPGEDPKVVLERVREEVESIRISTERSGVVVKTDALGSLEAVVNELVSHNIPIRIADVGDISKRDVTEAQLAKGESPTLGAVLGFDVKVFPEAEEEAAKTQVKIFRSDVIYHMIEDYVNWAREMEESKRRKTLDALVLPGKIKILPNLVFRKSHPAIFGVEILAGRIKSQSNLVNQEGERVGKVAQIQDKRETLTIASRGAEVAISMKEPTVGRHVREGEVLYVYIPEQHVKALRGELQGELTPEEVSCLEEYVEIMRKKNAYFGM